MKYNILITMPRGAKCIAYGNIKDLARKLHGSIFAVLYKKCRVGQGVKTPPFHGACLRDAVRQGITVLL